MTSSVVRIAEEACRAEGADLDTVRERRRRHGGYSTTHEWMRRFARVCARIRAHPTRPSYPEIAAVFGTSHSTIHEAVRRVETEVVHPGESGCILVNPGVSINCIDAAQKRVIVPAGVNHVEAAI